MSLRDSLLFAASSPNGWRDFSFGSWKPEGELIEDQRTERVYKNTDYLLSKRELMVLPRVESAALALMYPLYGVIGSVMHIFARMVNLFKPGFIPEVVPHTNWVRRYAITRIGRDLTKIAATPFALIAMQCSLLYAIALPREGKKLYASLERILYGGYVRAYYQSLYEDCPPLQPVGS